MEPIPRCPLPACSSTLLTHKCKPAFVKCSSFLVVCTTGYFQSKGHWGKSIYMQSQPLNAGSQCYTEPNLSGIGPIVPSSCREALFSSQTRARGWLDAVSCALCLRLLVLFGDIEFVVLGRSKIRDLTILTLFVKSQAWRACATFSASAERGFYTLY